jgi:eukaryotic-like serine/threonine-protein kinase
MQGVALSSAKRPISMTQPGMILGGKFQVLRTLGEGGMGVVYEVLHVITRHRRALKVLRAGVGDEHERARLLREASAAGRIGNPHITETYDAGAFDNGETYVLMEMLEGESLAGILKARRRLPVAEAVDLVLQACDGLGAAHAADVVHRDIKPANLFLTYPKGKDGPPFVKVLDFGVSKFDSGTNEQLTELTGDGMMLGTLAYMPPEQLEGSKTVDARADVYSLAVTLYTMVAGKRPFAGGSSMASLAVSILAGQSTPIRTYRPDLPDGFVQAIERAMHPNPAQRTQSAQAFAAELQPFLTWRSPSTGEGAEGSSEGEGGHATSSESGRSSGSIAPSSGYSGSGSSLAGASNSGERAVPSVVGHAQALQAAARRSMTDEAGGGAGPTGVYPSLVGALESASGTSGPGSGASSSLSAAASTVPVADSSRSSTKSAGRTRTVSIGVGAILLVMAAGAALAVATRPETGSASAAGQSSASASAQSPTAATVTTAAATPTPAVVDSGAPVAVPPASAEPTSTAKPVAPTAVGTTGSKRPPATGATTPVTPPTSTSTSTAGKPPLRRDNPY